MIIDQLCVFFDNAAAEAAAVSPAINISPYAGRGEAVNITVLLTGPSAAGLEITLQESGDNSAFADVFIFTLEKPDPAGAVLALALPHPVRKKFVRLSHVLTGAPTGLKLFAAVTRDHFAPYAEGQYIDHGKVVA